MTSQEIRQQFIDYFVTRCGHTFVPSSPVVPHDDPTLLFTNAGMNQFKPIFLGQETRAYTRAVNTQKCIRAGGKHNDLEDVGRSRRHHTFFEMLGNWSFGDYFKREAITWAWDLLTKVWKLDPSRLHVTCYEGDEANGVPRDTEAANLWKEITGMPDDHIHYFGSDNFWEMGETGPCGPCTEIHIDRTPDKTGGPLVGGDDPRVMEIWNLVFIQYNRNADRSLTPLPAKHVDTGMGFERITQVLQGKDDNYAIDLFAPYFAALTEMTGIEYAGMFPKTNVPDPAAEAASPQLRHDIAFRVIADHIRTLMFAITDGATPSNEGRGYVLRRILRRAVRFGRQQLQLHEPFFHQLVDVVTTTMGDAFPELKQHQKQIAEIIRSEEESFGKTLDRGIGLFNAATIQTIAKSLAKFDCLPDGSTLVAQGGPGGSTTTPAGPIENYSGGAHYTFRKKDNSLWSLKFSVEDPEPALKLVREFGLSVEIPGPDAFKLHDTYGFPIDLTQMMALEWGMTVDIAGYERLMEEARERARSGGKTGDARLWELPATVLAKLAQMNVPPTDDSYKHNAAPLGAAVRAIWDGSKLIEKTHGAEAAEQGVAVILDKTCFYAEQGGQVGDTGELRASSALLDVMTTRAAGGYILHVGRMVEGRFSVGDHVTATLAGVRPRTEKNHTATHLANWALREVLGEGVQQKGSLVDPDKLRFDFLHGKALGDEQIERVESLVQQCIERRLPVYADVAPQEQALKINGLRAVFGEKYPPAVRVVSIGVPVAELLKDPSNEKWREFSVEFCGGTHLRDTSEIESFVITSEESVSKGVRRIVALTGEKALRAKQRVEDLKMNLAQAVLLFAADQPAQTNELQKRLQDELPLGARRWALKKIAELQDDMRKREKSRSTSKQLDVASVAGDLLGNAEERGGGKVIVASVADASDDQLRSIIDSIRKRSQSFAAMLASASDGKVSFVAVVSDDLITRGLKAGDWVRETAKAAGGGGGGRPQMAQAGGKDPSKLPTALEVARNYARERLK